MIISSYSSVRLHSFTPHTFIHTFYQLMDAMKEEGRGAADRVTVYFACFGGAGFAGFAFVV